MGIILQTYPADTGDCGTFYGISRVPTVGMTQYTITGGMSSGDLGDSNNQLYLVIERAIDPLGEDFHPIAKSLVWQGGPGVKAPSLTWTFPVNQVGSTQVVVPPTGLRGKLVNGVGGTGTQGAPRVTVTDNI
ncbi:MAG: hypothetical protein KGL39_33390 [Patescibacteria group bacterium]|nr:hypothetical protein [Patescibacteria group bacterium]